MTQGSIQGADCRTKLGMAQVFVTASLNALVVSACIINESVGFEVNTPLSVSWESLLIALPFALLAGLGAAYCRGTLNTQYQPAAGVSGLAREPQARIISQNALLLGNRFALAADIVSGDIICLNLYLGRGGNGSYNIPRYALILLHLSLFILATLFSSGDARTYTTAIDRQNGRIVEESEDNEMDCAIRMSMAQGFQTDSVNTLLVIACIVNNICGFEVNTPLGVSWISLAIAAAFALPAAQGPAYCHPIVNMQNKIPQAIREYLPTFPLSFYQKFSLAGDWLVHAAEVVPQAMLLFNLAVGGGANAYDTGIPRYGLALLQIGLFALGAFFSSAEFRSCLGAISTYKTSAAHPCVLFWRCFSAKGRGSPEAYTAVARGSTASDASHESDAGL